MKLSQADDARISIINRAIKLVEGLVRPPVLTYPGAYPGEVLGWEVASPAMIVKMPNDLISASQIYLMSSEGFVYMFPLLLSLGILEPTDDFDDAVSHVFVREQAAYADVRPGEYTTVCRLLIEQWQITYSSYLNVLTELEDEDEYGLNMSTMFASVVRSDGSSENSDRTF